MRRTLYGGDQTKQGPDPLLDPAHDFARIRAFFIHPDFARRGIGRRIMETCEAAAIAKGFRGFELGSTLPGVALYRAMGYQEEERIEVPLRAGITLPVIHMTKRVGSHSV